MDRQIGRRLIVKLTTESTGSTHQLTGTESVCGNRGVHRGRVLKTSFCCSRCCFSHRHSVCLKWSSWFRQSHWMPLWCRLSCVGFLHPPLDGDLLGSTNSQFTRMQWVLGELDLWLLDFRTCMNPFLPLVSVTGRRLDQTMWIMRSGGCYVVRRRTVSISSGVWILGS